MVPGFAILLAAVAVALALGPSPVSSRLRRLSVATRPARDARVPATDERSSTARGLASARARATSAMVIGVAAGWWIGGFVGPVVGLCVGSVTWFGLGHLDSKVGVRDEATSARALPLVAELMSAAIAAGSPTVVAAEAVADALDGPIGAALRSAAATARLGSDPATAWLALGTDPAFRPLARALAASVSRGTSPNEVLDRVARDARDAARWAAEARARSLGARAAAPLGLCFLPAFVLVGIVPLVVTAAVPLLP
jgi:Flp pilus assembly protein TadB